MTAFQLAARVALAAGGLAATRPARGPETRVVEIRQMAFHPAELEVQRGDTVVWINRDIVPHTATASERPAWGTGIVGPAERGVHVVSGRGEVAYFCELHPGMRGKLVVR